MQKATETLTTLIVGEKQVLLSRKLGIHVNQAKELLWEYLNEKSDLHATYVVTGTRLIQQTQEPVATQDDLMESDQPTDDEPVQTNYCVKLVPQERLDDTMKEFEHVNSIHIYSIGPSNSNDPVVLSRLAKQLREMDAATAIDELTKYGVIKNGLLSTEFRSASRETSKESAAMTSKPSVVAASKVKAETKPEELKARSSPFTATKTEKKPEKKTEERPAAKPSPFSPFTKKGPVDSSAKNDGNPIADAWAKAKLKKEQESEPKEKVIVADIEDQDDNDEEDEEVKDAEQLEREAAERERQRKELEAMFDDDENAAEMEKPPADKESTAPAESVDDNHMDIAEEPTKALAEDSINKASETPEPEPQSAEATPDQPPGKRRGRRKVTKTVRSQDANGYLVTSTQTVWESCSEDETEKPPAPKPQPVQRIPPHKGEKRWPRGRPNKSHVVFQEVVCL